MPYTYTSHIFIDVSQVSYHFVFNFYGITDLNNNFVWDIYMKLSQLQRFLLPIDVQCDFIRSAKALIVNFHCRYVSEQIKTSFEMANYIARVGPRIHCKSKAMSQTE